MIPVVQPLPIFADLDGLPLQGGYLYFGEADENPETTPIVVYWDAAGTIPADQPIRTIGGLPSRSGRPGKLYISDIDCSMTVRNSRRALVNYVASMSQTELVETLLGQSGSSSLIGFIQAGTGAVNRTIQSKARERVDARDFGVTADGVTDDTVAFQAAADYCYNGGVSPTHELLLPPGDIVISDTIDLQCSLIGQGGGVFSGIGTTIKWMGSASYVFNIPDYVSGNTYRNFRIDTRGVITDVAMMYFAHGVNGNHFEDIEFRGYHSGASWGGTYKNHDGIVSVGGSGATKYDCSNNTFINVEFNRCRNGFTVPSDPSGGGPGNENTFIQCFFWCNGWSVKMFGASNSFTNVESNTESGNHAFVFAGGAATGWVFNCLEVQTASSSAGNQPLYADTAGAANFATLLGGQLFEADGGGFPALVLDAGPTGGRVYRYLTYGMNNVDSTALRVDNLLLGQCSVTQAYFYDEGTFTPTFTGLTVVLGGGSVTYSGKWTLIGNILYWSVLVQPAGGATTASTAGTTFINNMPYNQTGIAGTCTASNAGSLASYGVGQGAVGGKSMFPPSWGAVSNGIIISGFYFTDATT